jgi:hypothetical protein
MTSSTRVSIYEIPHGKRHVPARPEIDAVEAMVDGGLREIVVIPVVNTPGQIVERDIEMDLPPDFPRSLKPYRPHQAAAGSF